MPNDIYLGNPLLKKANTPIEFTKEQINEFVKCKKDPIYFAKNYVQIVTLDHGLVDFKPYKFQEKLIKRFHEHRFNICKIGRQSGKSLSLDTPIPTPTGWTTMGDVEVGDIILSPSGNEVSVTMKTETMYNHDCYKLYFDNGEEIIADSDHLWKVSSSYWRKESKVLTSKQIYNAYQKKTGNIRGKGVQKSFHIKITGPLKFSKKQLDIDPYLFGIWLGDGYSGDGRIVAHKDDYDFYKTRFDVEAERADNNCIRFKIRDLKSILIKNNLLNNKHIPIDYLRSSYEDRLELLRGLMDSDGSIKRNSRSFEFYQKNYELILQVVELLSTLGIKSNVRRKKIKDNYYYTISYSTQEIVFNLPRKIAHIDDKSTPRKQESGHYINHIEKVDSVPVACITVDSDDHMFLCGKTYIPTHNSTTVISYLLYYLLFNDNVNVAILANKASTSRELLSRLQTAYENLPKWLQQGILAWNKGSMELENGSKIIAASTSASAVRGGSYNIIFLDEFAHVANHIAEEFFASVYPTISSGQNTKVIIVSCVTKDTYLLTDKGYRKIDNFIDKGKTGAYIVPEYSVMGKEKFYNSDIIVNNKKSPTNIIKTRYETLECSEDHKLWAFKNGEYGYFRSNDLEVNDYVAIRYNQQVFGDDDYIGFSQDKGKSVNVFSCEYIDENIAYFIGLYISEGYAREIYSKDTNNLRGGQIIISCGDDIFEFLNKLNIPVSKVDDIHYVINSKQLVEFLIKLGFDINKKSKEKIIPDKVLSWSKKNITALLRGMFDGDGCIDIKGRVTYTSTSRELIRQVQLLLGNLGIVGSIYTNTSPPTKKVKVSSTHHTITITGEYALKYFNEIGFNLKRKSDRVSLIKKSNRNGGVTDIIPNSRIILEEHGVKLPSVRKKQFLNYSRQLLLSHKNSLFNNNQTIEFFNDNVTDNIIWVKIKEIEKSENEVYDVSLPDIENDKWCHSVLYNNFLGHQTPKGMNYFYKLWHGAERGKNGYVPTEVHWTEVPGRDEKWKKETIANTSEQQFRAEYSCEFLGSIDTLIAPSKLKNLVYDDPIKRSNGCDMYEEPIPDRDYLITVDVARGVGIDYSAFVVYDITSFPHKIVAKYRNNEIKPMLFPSIIVEIGKAYNNAYILCEVNDVGDQVASIIQYDLEYQNLLMCSMRGRAGQIVGQGFSGKKTQLGLKMSKTVKKVGCMNLKTMIEEDKLFVNDYEIISELTTFIQKHNSFEAEEGCNDDLAICLVIYAWLVAQDYFKELTDQDVRKRLYEEQKNQIEQDMAPFGFVSDGIDALLEGEVDEDGDVWFTDEYGDRSHEWSYMWDYR